MEQYLFETPRYGLIAAAILETAALIFIAVSQRRFKTLTLLAGPALAGLFFLTDWAVETNAEQVENNTRTVVQAVVDRKPQIIINLLSDDILINNKDKTKLAILVESWLSQPLATNNHISSLKINSINPKNAQVEFTAQTLLDPKSKYGVVPLIKSSWRFKYQCESDGVYRITFMVNLTNNVGGPINIF